MKKRLMLALASSAALVGCATSGLIESGGQRGIAPQVAQQAAQQHPQIVAEFGGEMGGQIGATVSQIGQRVAAQSGISSGYTFTALNSPVPNAFAVPGGRIYVTRGLMALMNSDEELAFVLGHEAGHIAADHSTSRQNTGLWSQLGSVLLGAVTGSSELAQLAGSVGQRYILSYSRGQEYEADDLGIRYMAGAGYNPLASTDILEALGAQGAVEARVSGREDDQRSTPSWARTHPTSAERVARARQQAQAVNPAGSMAAAASRDRWLNLIDGMLFGDDPAQGMVEGRDFLHPDLRFAFTAPQGYGIQNGTRAVSVSGANGQAQFSTGQFSGDLGAFIGQVYRGLGGGQTQIPYSQPQRTTINGIPAAFSTARVQAQQGVVDVSVVAYQFSATQAYYIATITRGGAGLGPFEPMVQSVRRLSAQEAAAVRPRVIEVVTAGPRDTVDTLARRMAYSTLQVERFRVLNGLTDGENVRAGQRVKLVVFGQRR